MSEFTKIRLTAVFSVEEHFTNEHITEKEKPEEPICLDLTAPLCRFIELEGEDLDNYKSESGNLYNTPLEAMRSRDTIHVKWKVLDLVREQYPALVFFTSAENTLDLNVERIEENKSDCFQYGFAISSKSKDHNGDELRFMCAIYKAEYC